MYEDLANNHLKKGMTVAEFTKLLGHADITCGRYNPDIKELDLKCYIYYMGTCYYGYDI
jgi:hypothetical protein